MSDKNETDKQNAQTRIFNDSFSFSLFEKLINDINNQTKTKLVDCSFIYRQMQKDNYINEYIGEKEFRDFLFKEYELEILEQLKPEHKSWGAELHPHTVEISPSQLPLF